MINSTGEHLELELDLWNTNNLTELALNILIISIPVKLFVAINVVLLCTSCD